MIPKQDIIENQIKEPTISGKMVNICKNCGNIHLNIWLKKGDDWNDFGFRYCPFCGMQTEEFAHIS